ASTLNEYFNPARVAPNIVLQTTRHDRRRSGGASIHQPIFRVYRVDAVAVFSVICFQANSRPLVQGPLDAQGVMRRSLRLEIRVSKLAEELHQIGKLGILSVSERDLRVGCNGNGQTASGHPDVLSARVEVFESSSPRKSQPRI